MLLWVKKVHYSQMRHYAVYQGDARGKPEIGLPSPALIIMDIERLLDTATADSDSNRPATIMVNVMVQSLAAHAEDISTHSLLLYDDISAIDEICLDAALVNNKNFQLFHQLAWEGCASVVAVYKRNEFAYITISSQFQFIASHQIKLGAMST